MGKMGIKGKNRVMTLQRVRKVSDPHLMNRKDKSNRAKMGSWITWGKHAYESAESDKSGYFTPAHQMGREIRLSTSISSIEFNKLKTVWYNLTVIP